MFACDRIGLVPTNSMLIRSLQFKSAYATATAHLVQTAIGSVRIHKHNSTVRVLLLLPLLSFQVFTTTTMTMLVWENSHASLDFTILAQNPPKDRTGGFFDTRYITTLRSNHCIRAIDWGGRRIDAHAQRTFPHRFHPFGTAAAAVVIGVVVVCVLVGSSVVDSNCGSSELIQNVGGRHLVAVIDLASLAVVRVDGCLQSCVSPLFEDIGNRGHGKMKQIRAGDRAVSSTLVILGCQKRASLLVCGCCIGKFPCGFNCH
mmetsp:Transcript_18298/g.26832  ORF Transcript_18298/g.26832 Transcript_18298/m.26832 type:complete len:259 (-) Transcript_18298:381-1157(-)